MDNPNRQRPASDAARPRLVAYVVSDDRLFATRYLSLARTALGMGLSAAVITSVRDHRAEIEAVGLRVVPMESGSGINPMKAGYAAGQLSEILKALKADLVHCIGLGSIVTGGTAAAMAGIGNRVYEPTGLASPDGLGGRLTRKGLAMAIRGPLASRGTRYVFETEDDARVLGFDAADIAVSIVDEARPEAIAADLYAELRARDR